MLMAIAISNLLTTAMSDLLFFRLEKLCPPDGSKVRFAEIKTLMQQYKSICASKIANIDAQKAEAAKIEHLGVHFTQ